MISDKHTFLVWHPKQGMPIEFELKEFEFDSDVTRSYARYLLEKYEGYAIKTEGKKRGPKSLSKRQRIKKQKVS